MNFGYARVGATDQDVKLQHDALIKYVDEENVYVETIGGNKTERPVLDDMMSKLRKGDTVYVWRLDRLGRSLKHLIQLVEYFNERDVGFVSLTEGFDTTTRGGKLVFNVFGAMAEFERNLIQERTVTGLEAARARGRRGGRPFTLTDKQTETLRKMYNSKKHSVAAIARTFGISRPTVYRYVNEDRGNSN